jgi:carotenoid cleavage dioxygenase-like enzyme
MSLAYHVEAGYATPVSTEIEAFDLPVDGALPIELRGVYDGERDRSEFVVLDACNIAAPPVATVPLPVRVPLCFHGNWMADDANAR